MRCLYIVANDPLSPNYVGGASAMYYDQLLALSELGHEVHLWHFASHGARARFNQWIEAEPATWAMVKSRCASLELYTYQADEGLVGRLLGRLRTWIPPRLPVSRWSLYRELNRQLARVRPHFVWAQHLEPALLAAQQSSVPVVYVHHDWLYRIKALRNQRASSPEQQAVEERLVRSVSAVVSGSHTECEDIRRAGARHVAYIPVSFEVAMSTPGQVADATPRLVHLGGMGATANRKGLLAFFKRVWPSLKETGVTLEVVGDTSAAPPELQEYLRTVTCAGFVQDLTTALRPFDIHIIPWEHATGQRTRLPVAFAMSQAVVSTRAAIACYPEAIDDVNCRLVDTLDGMAAAIRDLLSDPSTRTRLAHAARQTFETSFTREALRLRYAAVIADLQIRRPS